MPNPDDLTPEAAGPYQGIVFKDINYQPNPATIPVIPNITITDPSTNADNALDIGKVFSGNGSDFEKIIETLEDRLDSQFDKGRLNGTDYAKVYITAVSEAAQATLQWSLTAKGEQAKLKQIEYETQFKKAQFELDYIKLTNEVVNEAKKFEVEIEAIEQEKYIAENEYEIRKLQSSKDSELTDNQLLIGAQQLIVTTHGAVQAKFQAMEAENKALLMRAKAVTEIAQTSDSVPNYFETITINGEVLPKPLLQCSLVPFTGIQAKQKKILEEQAKGFQKNTQQNVLNTLVEVWKTSYSINEGGAAEQPPGSVGAGDDSIANLFREIMDQDTAINPNYPIKKAPAV